MSTLDYISIPPKPSFNDTIVTERFSYDYWTIGLFESSNPLTPNGAVTWIKNPNSHTFLADPFPFIYKSTKYIICEEFDYRILKGNIITGQIKNGRFVKTADLFFDNYHRSYPFVFSYNNKNYFIPEQSSIGSVAIYELASPSKANLCKTILNDFAALDSTLFRHNNLWWLFASHRDDKAPGKNLFLFYSRDPFCQWRPHPLNPVVTNSASARPAGNLIVTPSGTIIRPGQDCSHTYGKRITMNTVLELTTEMYTEKPIGQLCTKSKQYNRGLHTINKYQPGVYLVDAKKSVFRFDANYRKTLNKFSNLRKTQ